MAQVKYPCSPAQHRFWVLDQLDPHSPALNVAVRWKLEGMVTHTQLETAIQLTIARHQALRTSFCVEDGDPMQVIAAQSDVRVPMIDLSALTETEALQESERMAHLEARASFDLGASQLIRFVHLRVRQNWSMLLVTAHHIVCDGWSIGILARDIGMIYATLQRGEAPRLRLSSSTYAEYATRQMQQRSSPRVQAQLEYWKKKLAGMKYFEILADHPRPISQTSNGNILSILLPRSLTNGLTELSRRNGYTLFMTSLTVFMVLLHRYTGETDIAIGSQFAGRDEVELEDMVGLFINTLVLRNDLSGNPTFLDLAERVKDTVLDAYEYQNVSLDQLIEALKPKRDKRRSALFSVNFIFQRSFIRNEDYGSFKLIDLPSCPAGAMYDLNVFMVERPDGWRASCEYNTDLFDPPTIRSMLGHFRVLLQAAVKTPSMAVAALPLLDDDERAGLLRIHSGTYAAFPDNQTVASLFEAQALRTPHAVAAMCENASITYRELDEGANRLAHHLRAINAAPGALVGVYLERSLEMVIALLGILKAGSAYIPLDPAYPVERIVHVLENAQPAALITRSTLAGRLPETSMPLVLVDRDAKNIESQPTTAISQTPKPQDLAYVIYTSGSTGRPKGVKIRHRSVVNLLWSMLQRPGLLATDVVLSVTTISFDIAALELFLPLIAGARVIVALEEDVLNGPRLQHVILKHQVTFLQATPATWQLLIESGWRLQPKLKMLCGGEVMPRKLAEIMAKSDGEVWNMYGPTETTIWSSALRVETGEGPVPLGPPIANTQFYVLDARQELVPAGVPGELYIGGEGLADGYHDLPELSRNRFIENKFSNVTGARLYRTGDIVRMRADASFDYLGRADHQVKLRGVRIELGEIQSILEKNVDIKEAVAMVAIDKAGEPALRAYVSVKGFMREKVRETAEALREDLKKYFPIYMCPSSVLVLDALPRTPNGKIDRAALLEIEVTEYEDRVRAEPVNDVEAKLAVIWGEVLGLRRVERDVDFIDLGGHSLLVARLSARIESEFGKKISLGTLFKAPTIAEQAGLLMRADLREYDFRQTIRLQPNGSNPPLIAINNTGVYFYNLSRYLGPEYPLTVLQLFDPSLKRPELPRSFEDIAAEYVQLVRKIQPAGPYKVVGWCIGGALAFEVARQLNAAKQDVSALTVLDTWAPGYMKHLTPLRAKLVDYSYRWQLIKRDWVKVTSRQGGIGEFLSHRVLFKKMSRLFNRADQARADRQAWNLNNRSEESHDQWLLAYLGAAASRYQPKPYAGRLNLIRSSQEPRGIFLDYQMGWRSLCEGGVEVVTVEGDHFTMFQEPGVGQIARHMSVTTGEHPRTVGAS